MPGHVCATPLLGAPGAGSQTYRHTGGLQQGFMVVEGKIYHPVNEKQINLCLQKGTGS